LKVLYVEDEPVTRRLMKKLLESEGMSVSVASGGIAGLQLYADLSPDIIVTDLVMPAGDGFEMITAIRKIDKTIPIILTTGYTDDSAKLSQLVDYCMYKPIIKEALIDVINKFSPVQVSNP
jgi:CheY-like chemotaxis protein